MEDARLTWLEGTEPAAAISPLPRDVPSIASRTADAYHDDDYEEEMDEGHSLDPCPVPIAASVSPAATQCQRSPAGVVSDATDAAPTTMEDGHASYTMPSTTVGATAGAATKAITDAGAWVDTHGVPTSKHNHTV